MRRVLAFLNIIEPGPVLKLSPTRVGMWAVIFVMLWIALYAPANIGAIFAAIGGAVPMVVNYIFHLNADVKAGTNPNRFPTPTQVSKQPEI